MNTSSRDCCTFKTHKHLRYMVKVLTTKVEESIYFNEPSIVVLISTYLIIFHHDHVFKCFEGFFFQGEELLVLFCCYFPLFWWELFYIVYFNSGRNVCIVPQLCKHIPHEIPKLRNIAVLTLKPWFSRFQIKISMLIFLAFIPSPKYQSCLEMLTSLE